MSILQTFVLRAHDHSSRQRAAKWMLEGPEGTVIQCKEPTRGGDQSAKFHAICGDLAKSGLQWAGKTRDAAAWKVLLVSGHTVATKQEVEIVPGLENEFVNVRESTALMSIKRASSLIEYSLAFCAMHGVKTTDGA